MNFPQQKSSDSIHQREYSMELLYNLYFELTINAFIPTSTVSSIISILFSHAPIRRSQDRRVGSVRTGDMLKRVYDSCPWAYMGDKFFGAVEPLAPGL